MKHQESALRASYRRLRDVCKSFEERLLLGEAIRRGWPAHAIESAAKIYSGRCSKDIKLRQAIQDTAKRTYYSPEQQAADRAAHEAQEAANDARRAIRATKSTRPIVPSKEWAPIRAACASMLDCDRLQTILDEGWDALDVIWLARQFSEVAGHRKPLVATPAAIRLTLELIEHRAAGQYSPFLPRPRSTN